LSSRKRFRRVEKAGKKIKAKTTIPIKKSVKKAAKKPVKKTPAK